MSLQDDLRNLPIGETVKISRRENEHKDEIILDVVFEDGHTETFISPKDRMNGCKCKVCGRRYHVCSSCDTWGMDYLNDDYCTLTCAEKDGWKAPVWDD